MNDKKTAVADQLRHAAKHTRHARDLAKAALGERSIDLSPDLAAVIVLCEPMTAAMMRAANELAPGPTRKRK